MLNEAGELIYVGKAKCLRTRLLSYFRTKSRDPKAGRILKDACVVAWEPAHGEFAALLRELRVDPTLAAALQRPGPAEPSAAHLRLRRPRAGRVPVSVAASAGHGLCRLRPRAGRRNGARGRPPSQRLVSAARLPAGPEDDLRRPGRTFPPRPKFRLSASRPRRLSRPLRAACTRGDYAAAVRSAVRFLEGDDISPLETLERDMQAASAAEAFERAAALRDKWKVLHWLSGHLQRLREASRRTCVYPARGRDGARPLAPDPQRPGAGGPAGGATPPGGRRPRRR